MKLFNHFVGGAMDKDTELRLVPKGVLLDAQNVRIVTNSSNNNRSVKPLAGTTSQSFNNMTNGETKGVCFDGASNRIFWAVSDDNGSYVYSYDTLQDDIDNVMVDTRGASAVIDFSQSTNVEMQVLNDTDNGRQFLFITDGVNEPLYLEVGQVKAVNTTFTAEQVSLLKAPPINAPTFALGDTPTSKENTIETRFYSFAYRYKYRHGEYSALSPFSDFAFIPKGFSYNYREATNSSMFNNYSKADITFNVGGAEVTDIELIVKESGSNTAYIVQTYNRDQEGWSTDDANVTVTFDNAKAKRTLDSNQLNRLYDNVPIKAAALEIIGNRVVFGNYTENYDLTYEGDPLDTVLSLSYQSASGTSGQAHTTVKSNRTYEVAISYLDGKGRMTPPITTPGNTVFVENKDADMKNTLRVTIDKDSRPPDWATNYRFFVKQYEGVYDVLSPITFYRDGLDAWVKLEGNDQDKVEVGDFLYVKSGTSGLTNDAVRTKVLEITSKTRNFLETEDTVITGEETLQEPGLYMRIRVQGFALSTSSIVTTEWSGFAFRSDGTSNNFASSPASHLEDTYGDGSNISFFDGTGLNDMKITGTLTGDADIRIEVEVTGTGTPNQVRWRVWDITNDSTPGSWNENVNMVLVGSKINIGNGLFIHWDATTGHSDGDVWFGSAKAQNRPDDWNKGGSPGGSGRKAIVILQAKPTEDNGEEVDEGIRSGATITVTYDDTPSSNSDVSDAVGFKEVSFTTSKNYPNIEEAFFGEEFYNDLEWQDLAPDVASVIFRRGVLGKSDGQQLNLDNDQDSPKQRMYWTFLSPAEYLGGARIRVDNTLVITELENPIIFETIPVENSAELFFELPQTFAISGGNHQGTQNQIFGSTDGYCDLTWYNAFGWYNGFESIKIGDVFTGNTMLLDTRASAPVDDYKQITRIASLTYSDVYEGTTQFNAINEFNLSESNFKDMDIQYGAIRKLYSEDTNLEVYQDDKTHKVLFSKSIIFNADGSGNVSANNQVLGQEVAYAGDYGIAGHPESWAVFGSRRYHLDIDRGVLLRLSTDGYTEISQQGMHDYFRTLARKSQFPAGYDPYFDEYVINIGTDLSLGFSERAREYGGFTSFYGYEPERLIGANNRFYGFKNGKLYRHDDAPTLRNQFYGANAVASSIRTIINDGPNDQKVFKSLNIEANSSNWSVDLKTNYVDGTISTSEWQLREGEYYAYIRQGEDVVFTGNTDGIHTLTGIGEYAGVTTLTLRTGTIPQSAVPAGIAVGDTLYFNDSGTVKTIGVIQSYSLSGSIFYITVDAIANTPTVGDLLMFGKSARVEGEAMRGHYLDLTFTNAVNEDFELFAYKVEAVRSSD